MIRDEDIERALDWLRDQAEDCAQAAANRVTLEEGRKHLKAIIMKECANLPLGAQEREAYADPRYEAHIKGLAAAVFEHEKMKMLREAAVAKIDAWRTQQSNQRAMKV